MLTGPNAGKAYWTTLPFIISSIRGVLAPLIFYYIIDTQKAWALGVFLIAGITDVLDGYLSKKRRLMYTTAFEKYYDPILDYFLIVLIFLAFVMKKIYPNWVVILLSGMFFQFILTSGLKHPVYDPVGKYYGAFLFAVIGLTLTFPHHFVYTTLLISVLVMTGISITSRLSFFVLKRRS